MSINLLHHVSDKITDATIFKLSTIMGMDSASTESAVANVLPTLLKGIVSRADTADEASALRSFIRTNNIASNVATDFLNLDRDSTSEYQEIGNRAIGYLFGGAEDSLMSNLEEKSGLDSAQGRKLTQLIAPLALGHVSKLGNRENLTDVQLSAYLKSQKENLMNPDERKQTETSKPKRKSEDKKSESPIAASGLIKWIIPFIALLGFLWWIGQKGCASADTKQAGTNETINKRDEGIKTSSSSGVMTNTAQKTNSIPTKDGWYVNSDGHLVDGNGMVVMNAGEFSVTDGYYVDKSGETLSPLSNPLNKSMDEFKKNFSNILMTKKSVGTTYALSQIEFNKDSHKITKFSKAEIEGLANALRTIPGAKIQVQVFSNDGDDQTKLRAQVVKDMLVTLGVDKGQISSKGMGKQDAVKAANNKVEIKVEEVK